MSRRVCTVEGCDRPHEARGYCQLHGRRVAKHGDPHHVRDRSGDRNPAWAGDGVGYAAAHERVAGRRGPAREYACIVCGGRAAHWAYRHDDPNELLSPDGHPYSGDPDHYDPKCVPCHKRADLARLGMLRTDEPKCGPHNYGEGALIAHARRRARTAAPALFEVVTA